MGNRAGHSDPFLPFLCVGHASFQLHCDSCRKGEACASELPIAQQASLGLGSVLLGHYLLSFGVISVSPTCLLGS